MHTYYIDKIIKSDDTKKMEEMKELFIDTISYLKNTDHEKYEKIECKLYEIVEGKRLTEEKAKEWVKQMSPSAKWTMSETNDVRERYKAEIPQIDFYVLMNMLYSDYKDVVGEEVDRYIKLSDDWYYDEDVDMDGSEKLYCYGKYIAKIK